MYVSSLFVNLSRVGQRVGSRLISVSACRTTAVIDPPDTTLSLPEYQKRKGESLQQLKSRLVYQSRKRGMLENGLLLSSFASKFLNNMSEQQLRLYDNLINKPSNDWDIYYWATDLKPTPEEYDNEVMEMLKEFVKNPDRQSRIRQPDL